MKYNTNKNKQTTTTTTNDINVYKYVQQYNVTINIKYYYEEKRNLNNNFSLTNYIIRNCFKELIFYLIDNILNLIYKNEWNVKRYHLNTWSENGMMLASAVLYNDTKRFNGCRRWVAISD